MDQESLFVLERGPAESSPGPLVVAVHGTMDRHSSFLRMRRDLGELRTILYDRRGYGRSRALPVAAGLDDHVDDLLGLCAGRPAVVVGHSYGACVALRAAQRVPAVVRALVAFEPPLPWLPGWPSDTGSARALAAPDPDAAVEAFLRRILGDERWEALPERARDDRRAEGPALLADLRSVRPAVGTPAPIDLGAVRVPVVVGRGTRSPGYLRDGADRLVGLLPDAEPWVVEGAGHDAHASRPDHLAAMTRRALARCRP
ncbi:MAG: alpha/beta hydrolase [Acidimicrobiales bacterium]